MTKPNRYMWSSMWKGHWWLCIVNRVENILRIIVTMLHCYTSFFNTPQVGHYIFISSFLSLFTHVSAWRSRRWVTAPCPSPALGCRENWARYSVLWKPKTFLHTKVFVITFLQNCGVITHKKYDKARVSRFCKIQISTFFPLCIGPFS